MKVKKIDRMRKSRMGRMRLHAAFVHCAKPRQKRWISGQNTMYVNRKDAFHVPSIPSVFPNLEWSINDAVDWRPLSVAQKVMSLKNSLLRLALMNIFNNTEHVQVAGME